MSTHIHNILAATLCLLVFNTLVLTAQTDYLQPLQMNQALDPPQNILSSKSLVLISVPADAPYGEWKEKAAELQTYFAEQGIDAIAYLNVDRHWAVPGFQPELPKLLTNRKISNLIFLMVGGEGQESIIGMGPFNGRSSYYDRSAIFWTRQFTDIKGVFDELTDRFKTGAFKRENLLVNESPEFFDTSKPAYAANYPSFPPNLQLKKIGIPLLKPLGNATGAHLLSVEHYQQPGQFNREVTDRNARLETLLADSSLTMLRVDLGETSEALLRRDGYTHLLYYVESDSEYLYGLFNYKNRVEVESKKLVKFFLKDLSNRNIFLGRSWDAAADWQTALDNFLAQMHKELAVKGG